MSSTFNVRVDMAGFDLHLDAVAAQCEAAARPAAQAMAQLLYDEIRRNVAAIGPVTGNLGRSIYQHYVESKSTPGRAFYSVGVNEKKAPHGHLVEYGHLQRYVTFVGKDGKWHTAVRPEAKGKPKPKRRGSQAEKDAYFVMRKDGGAQVAARPFIRPAMAKFGAAMEAARRRYLDELQAKGVVR